MAEQDAPARTAPRTRTWVKVLLAVSLGLNLAVLGLVAGAGLREGVDRRFGPSPDDRVVVRDLGLSAFIDAFPREHRREMAEVLRERSLPIDRRKIVSEIEAMLDVLRADPYEPDALLAILETQRSRVSARLLDGRDVMLEQIASLTTAERRRFADHLEHSLQRAISEARRSAP